MSIELDWQVVDQDTDSPEDQPPPSSAKPPPRRWRTRHTWLVLVGLVLLIVAALAAYSAWTYHTRVNQVSGQVRLVSQLEARAVTTDDLASFVALQDPDDWAWRAMQEKRFARLDRVGLPEFGWKAMGAPSQPGDISLEPGGARLDVTYPFSVTQPMPGGPVSITLYATQFYKPTPSGWVRAMPGPDFWGRWRTKSGKRFAIAYVQRDASLLEPLIPRMDEMLGRVCGPLPCPSQPVFIIFDITADTLARLSGFSNGFDDGAFMLRLPSPHLFGVPADARSRDELYRALGTRVVQALVYEASQRRLNMSYLSSQEVLRWELAQAGLTGPFITPAITPTLIKAMQSGSWQPLDAIPLRSSPSGIEAAPGEVMMSLALDFLEQRFGEGTVAHLLPAMASGRARTLGDVISTALRVNPATLRVAWLTYLRNRAGLPVADLAPPAGELALLCALNQNRSAVWRIRTDGTGLEKITRDDQNAAQPAWSQDGKMLAYRQSNVGVVMDADTRQFKTLAARQSINGIAWLPDGRVRVNIQGDATSHLVDLDTEQVTEITRTSPIWSPDGKQMAYQAFAPSTPSGILIADANGGDEQRVEWGATPAWSPDGKRLAFLSGSALTPYGLGVELEPATEISIVDATGYPVTRLRLGELLRTLVGAPDLASWASDLIWSPDGSMLAVCINRREGPMLLIVDADTGALRTHWRKASGRLLAPAWSPSSRQVAFQVMPGGQTRADTVGIVDAQTGDYLALPGRGFDWSPDGKWLAVTEEPTGVLLVTPDWASIQWLETSSCSSVAWRPGGR